MRNMKWIGVAAGILLVVACFLPWVIIESKNITVTGIDATGTNFGKPGYIHLVLVVFFFVFTLVPRLWAKRANLFVVALNSAWAVRNFLIIATCRSGECPDRQIGIYLLLIASLVVLVSALFPDMKMQQNKNE